MTTTNGVVSGVRSESETRPTPPDPEVLERARRRQFTASYKLRILEEADQCSVPGQLGVLLRREGLYSSHLAAWRRHRAQGTLAALGPRRRGQAILAIDPADFARLRHENERLARQLATAETIIEIQKKVSTLFGLTQPSANDGGRQ
jgi:transposase-like protein